MLHQLQRLFVAYLAILPCCIIYWVKNVQECRNGQVLSVYDTALTGDNDRNPDRHARPRTRDSKHQGALSMAQPPPVQTDLQKICGVLVFCVQMGERVRHKERRRC
jgi:hypothetical protein